MNAHIYPPVAKNEPVLAYAPGSPERHALEATLKSMRATELDIPMYIDGERITTGLRKRIAPPHDHQHTLGYYHYGNSIHINAAIDAALKAQAQWSALPWTARAAVFLKAADLITGPYRARVNASTMLCQSKTIHQAEIDAVCETADFLRFNVQYASRIYAEQPASGPGMWNMLEYRPLEGFILAITPFNFTSIAVNLPVAPALMGNVCVWKPAETQIYSAHVLMEILIEAGLPAGVINLIYADGAQVGEYVFKHNAFAGLHFTGSTGVFRQLWHTISSNLEHYRNFPRIVGETGGKDFIIAHSSADPNALATAMTRGAFEFQGQKCSAASRAYIPQSLWSTVQTILLNQLQRIKTGPVEDFSNFCGAVIDERAFDKIVGYIDAAKSDPSCTILAGGTYDKSKGYFIEPTVILTTNPQSKTMVEEIFGPVLTVYVYPDKAFEETLQLVDATSPYALTGAIFAQDRYALVRMTEALRHAAGNFYLNDKPTGAVVDQQPFGGARASGTNDKAGSIYNLIRWVSPRTIKETFVPPHDFAYPFLGS